MWMVLSGRLLMGVFTVPRRIGDRNPLTPHSWLEFIRAPEEARMVHRYVFHNDRLLPIEQVRLSPGQAGLLSGWGLFTTMRIAGGVPFAYERHWKRLEKDAARTHCPFP